MRRRSRLPEDWPVGPGLLAASLHGFTYVFVLSSSINGLCHHVGYRNFDNTATNIRLLALVTGGEGLHNNHHGFPRSPKFSVKASEFDPAWPLIKLLIVCGLARPSKTIAEIAAQETRPSPVSADAVGAVADATVDPAAHPHPQARQRFRPRATSSAPGPPAPLRVLRAS